MGATPAFCQYALCVSLAAALLTGCGGFEGPVGPPGPMPQVLGSAAAGVGTDRGGSWMLPGAQTQDLLYVTDYSSVTVYTYPQGKHMGTLTGFGSAVGECVDNRGDVFVTNQLPARIYEFAHGGTKRFATLKTHVGPVGCAIDPVTGDLAVAGFSGVPPGPGIDIFKRAKGKAIFYKAPLFYFTQFCGYDNKGDLFVDGPRDQDGDPALAELPKGSRSLVSIRLNATIYASGGVQWHNKYLAVGAHVPPRGSQSTPVIYQFAISGTQGRKVGTTILGGPGYNTFQFFISKGTVIVPNWYYTSIEKYDVLFYKYPAGGSPTMILSKDIYAPRGVVISQAASRPLH